MPSHKPISMLRFIGYVILVFAVVLGLMLLKDRSEMKMTAQEIAARDKTRDAKAAETVRVDLEKKALKAESTCKDELSAYVMSQSFVQKQLKSPATAVFPNMSTDGVRTQYLGGCLHKISGYVDSQNGFGALLRTRYLITVRNVKGTDSWQVEQLKFEN